MSFKDLGLSDALVKAVKEKGYKWFEDNNNKGYDVNIVGVRNIQLLLQFKKKQFHIF